MNIEELREYCITKKGVTEGFPFDNTSLVLKVMNKIFAIIALDKHFVNLKCDPEYAIELREKYAQIIPGYHMNKQQWNSVYFAEGLSDDLIKKLVDDSYDLIVAKFTKKLKKEFDEL